MRRLAFYLDRYGSEIEADFQGPIYSGLDLGELWRMRRWGKILRLINQLPQASRYYAAVANDEEHVALLVKAQEGRPAQKYSPPMSQWSQEVDVLASIHDGIQHLIGVTVAVSGNKAPSATPYARPETAFAAIRENEKLKKHQAIVDRVRKAREAQVE